MPRLFLLIKTVKKKSFANKSKKQVLTESQPFAKLHLTLRTEEKRHKENCKEERLDLVLLVLAQQEIKQIFCSFPNPDIFALEYRDLGNKQTEIDCQFAFF